MKSHNTDMFTSNVRKVTDSLCQLTEETSQAAYLIGVSHPSSEPDRVGLIDIAFFERLQRDIRSICRAITSHQVTDREVRFSAFRHVIFY